MLIDVDTSRMKLLKAVDNSLQDDQVGVLLNGTGTESVYSPTTTLKHYHDNYCMKHDNYCMKHDNHCMKHDNYCMKHDNHCMKHDNHCMKHDNHCMKHDNHCMKHDNHCMKHQVNHDIFTNQVFKVFDQHHQSNQKIDNFIQKQDKFYLNDIEITNEIQETRQKLKSIEWVFGNHKVHLIFHNLTIQIEKGIITVKESMNQEIKGFLNGKHVGKLIFEQYEIPNEIKYEIEQIINLL
jgi:hypothetical protein